MTCPGVSKLNLFTKFMVCMTFYDMWICGIIRGLNIFIKNMDTFYGSPDLVSMISLT